MFNLDAQTEKKQTKSSNKLPTMLIKLNVRHHLTPSVYHGPLHIISEIQLRESIHKWLSPPNPSTNHNIACGTHHKKAATWFFQGSIFREWKSTSSLLWIHGKRAPSPTSHRIHSDEILNCSWLRQEYSLVSGYLALSIIGA
jgi:hypothetical protein